MSPQAPSTDPKSTLQRYLQRARDAIVWKTEGLSERDLRLPRTVTGTNLLGLVKHCASVELGYFGYTFGRPWPDFDEIPWMASWIDPNAPDEAEEDLFATADESAAGLIDLYRRVWSFADETIAGLDLDAPGRVPWWENGDVTLHLVLVHVVSELQRHAGHADIVREGIDGAAGVSPAFSNLWTPVEQRDAHVTRLRELAERFPA
jgi:hypothetical protein